MDETGRCPRCGAWVTTEYFRHDKRTGRVVCCTVCTPNHIKQLPREE